MSAFVGEISSAVITFIFNMLILGLTGSTGVAAYGVVANMSLVGMAVTNGGCREHSHWSVKALEKVSTVR